LSNRPSKKRSSSARVQAAARANKSSNTPWIIGGSIIVVVGILLVVAVAHGSSSGQAGDIVGRKDAPATIVDKVTGVPSTVVEQVGKGSANALPQPINGPEIKVNGKPGVLFIGAEFCPYCAAERWSLANALSRFGSFTGLKITNSAPTDGDIRTLTFYGSSYKSDYVAFQTVEEYDNSHNKLESPTSTQNSIFTQFAGSQPSYPFLYFNGKYVLLSASFDYSVLSGKSWNEIAAALSDPNSSITKAVVGGANTITATICILTGDQPASACSPPAIKSLETQIKNQKSTTSPSSNGNSSNG
jgi:hypothetical protein